MDSKVFGQFIARVRKEKNMTQADLAKIIGVTDKAISRWERGIGFPDINTLEPLANALGISVLELMRSEKADMEQKNYSLSENEVTEMMSNAVEMAKKNRRQDKISAWLAGIVTIAVAVCVKMSGRANIGGALAVGAFAALVIVAMYLFDQNKGDRESRKVYGFFMLVGIGISIFFLQIMDVNPSAIIWGLFAILGLFMERINSSDAADKDSI